MTFFSIVQVYLSNASPEPAGQYGPRHFSKQFTIGCKFQLWENLAEDGRRVSACLQPASFIPPGLTGTRNAFQPLHLFCSYVKEAQHKQENAH